MKKIALLAVIAICIGGAGWWAARYFGLLARQPVPLLSSLSQTSASPSSVSWKVEEVATDLEVPWSIVFTSPTRMLVTERPGRVRVIENGQLLAAPLHTFSEVVSQSEEGLMGLAVDPEYAANRFLYFSLAYQKNNQMVVKIVRLTDEGTQLTNPVTILDDIPAAQYHAGNRLKFGPDGKLYSTTGDATDRELAQNMNSLAGKILRLNPDGSIPEDNPFPNSLIYSVGHRNPQGLDWHPLTGQLLATEHGPSLFDGPAGGDELNAITAGGNYGWPLVSHDRRRDGTTAPLLVYTPAEAPGSGMFYRSDTLPQFKNNYFFGALKGEGVIRVVVDDTDATTILSQEKLFLNEYGRIREVVEGIDGSIYFSTSNKDGRGRVRTGDDKILRIVRE